MSSTCTQIKNHTIKFFFFKKENVWISNSFLEIKKRVEKIKVYLINNGIRKGDRVFLLSNNRIEWVEFDLAIMSVGAITVPSFVTNNQSDNAFILNDCKPSFLILENDISYGSYGPFRFVMLEVMDGALHSVLEFQKSSILRSI